MVGKSCISLVQSCHDNAFILYNESHKFNSMQVITQYNFRLNVVKQLLHSVTTKQKSRHVNPFPDDVLRLSDKTFPEKNSHTSWEEKSYP